MQSVVEFRMRREQMLDHGDDGVEFKMADSAAKDWYMWAAHFVKFIIIIIFGN